MGFFAYRNIPDEVLDQRHQTATGKEYTIRSVEKLRVEMEYIGKEKYNSNSQGWKRDKTEYFTKLSEKHPEMFSKKNILRIKAGEAPIVDSKMIKQNPQWADYKGQALKHHHIGGDGEAVAVPSDMHKGYGEIHNHEKQAGITARCSAFSEQCAKNPNSIGKIPSQLHGEEQQAQNLQAGTNIVLSREETLRTIEKQQAAQNHTTSRKEVLENSMSSQQSRGISRGEALRGAFSTSSAHNAQGQGADKGASCESSQKK